jgi:hypothetical protein
MLFSVSSRRRTYENCRTRTAAISEMPRLPDFRQTSKWPIMRYGDTWTFIHGRHK